MTRAARVAAVAATLVASTLPQVAGAHARSVLATATTSRDAIELISQDPWTPVGGDLRIGVRISASVAAAPDATVRVVASQPLGSRADFDRVVAEGVRGTPFDEFEVAVTALPADAAGTHVLTLGLESPQRLDPTRLALRRAGVYPLTIELRTSGAEKPTGSSFTTFAVVTEALPDGQPRQLASRLGVAWVWPLQEGPALLPDGSRDPAVLQSFEPDGRLGRQAASLARAGDVRLTLAPGPETLEAWVARGRSAVGASRSAAAVLDAVGRTEIVAPTYVPTDIASLLRGGLDDVVETQLLRGREVLAGLVGAQPSPSIAVARLATSESLARLRASGVTQVVIDDSALASDPADPSILTQPFQLRTGDGSQEPLAAVASDSGLVSLFAGDIPPALRAQRILAGLSIVALEAPSATRAVVLASQPELAAPSALFDALLGGLRGNPWLNTMTVSEVFAGVPPGGGRNPAVRALAPPQVPDPPVSAFAYRLTEAHVDAFEAFVGSTDPVVIEGRQALLVVESSTFAGVDGVARASATLDHVNEQIDAFVAGIRVPDPGTITLTSRSGEIPLTFRNDTGRRVRIAVTVESSKLFFPDGTTYTIDLAPRSTTLRVAVEARTSGTFPLGLSVRTADGGLVIAETRLQVRSTVVSTVGLTLMISAAVVLALWWALYIRRARKRRREGAGRRG